MFTAYAANGGDGVERESTGTASWSAADLAVHALIAALGALQLLLTRRLPDFYLGDVAYFDLARSIVEHGTYARNFRPETMVPPGFPLMLAGIWAIAGGGYTILLRAVMVSGTLGFMASYELLRRQQGRAVAAVVCLLLYSSPLLFSSEAILSPGMPYLLASTSFLLLALYLERQGGSAGARAAIGLLLALLLIASVMIRSEGLALVGGLGIYLVVSWWNDRRSGASRLWVFVPALVLCIAAQGLWTFWAGKRETSEWPLAGFPGAYLSQLWVKDGHYPELGVATLADFSARIETNLIERTGALASLLLRKEYLAFGWFSPLITVPVLLILLGWGWSVWRTAGRTQDWYFAIHEAMFLVWPWKTEIRFVAPIAPLACLYLCRGVTALRHLVPHAPRWMGGAGLLLGLVLGVDAATRGVGAGSLQPTLALLFWGATAAISLWILATGSTRPPAALASLARAALPASAPSLARAAAWIPFAALFGLGIALQINVGRDLLELETTTRSLQADVEAAAWIQSHTPDRTVVMARQFELVSHYSGRKVVWFPPLRDAEVLWAGIRRHGVEFVIVTDSTGGGYFLPPERDCFSPLLAAHPEAFRLAERRPGFSVYEVRGYSERTRLELAAPERR